MSQRNPAGSHIWHDQTQALRPITLAAIGYVATILRHNPAHQFTDSYYRTIAASFSWDIATTHAPEHAMTALHINSQAEQQTQMV